MDQSSTFIITVPATTANIGPGFDCLGAALSRYNRFCFCPSNALTDSPKIHATGLGADRLNLTADNLLYQGFLRVYQYLGQPAPAVTIQVEMDVPLSRGLGSSATAIVGGIVGANALAGSPLSSQTLLQLAIEMEGHPDNIVPAFLGGCQLTASNPTQTDFPWTICEIPWHDRLVPVVAIPDLELSTQAARQVLPLQYDRADAIFNMAHLGLLLRGLEQGREDWLRTALRDRIHQPYRKVLIPGFDDLEAAALNAGAYGLVISGAGPSVLALVDQDYQESVTMALQQIWQDLNMTGVVQPLALQRSGVKVETLAKS
ncbi:MAG: homoserine kinase [Prochlorotrichaceae cyanobacterium]